VSSLVRLRVAVDRAIWPLLGDPNGGPYPLCGPPNGRAAARRFLVIVATPEVFGTCDVANNRCTAC
jgi:hypothetical protein